MYSSVAVPLSFLMTSSAKQITVRPFLPQLAVDIFSFPKPDLFNRDVFCLIVSVDGAD